MDSLYIHIPFCKKKCNYCDFYSVTKKEYLIDKYLTALWQEIIFVLQKNEISINDCAPSTIYIGGGSPSILNCEQLSGLFYILKNTFDLSKVIEITLEVNPESATHEKIMLIKEFSDRIRKDVLRLSIGVQSFNKIISKFAGRVHDINSVFSLVELLHKNNIKNYSFDLIYGFPNQTIKDVEYDIKTALMLIPKHISYYALTIEKNTRFYNLGFDVDGDLQADMYKMLVSKLEENGYRRYEVSNFAKEGYESKHNLNYWNYKSYFGFGPSATSFFNSIRKKNISGLDDYIDCEFFYEEEELDEKTKFKEKIMLSLRTENGIKIDDYFLKHYRSKIIELLDQNLCYIDDRHFKIVPDKFFISNQIISKFF